DRSRLRHALLRHLVVRDVDGAPALVLGDAARVRFGAVVHVDPLTAFEARFLADNDVPLPGPASLAPPRWHPRTDLHTHFAAAVRPPAPGHRRPGPGRRAHVPRAVAVVVPGAGGARRPARAPRRHRAGHRRPPALPGRPRPPRRPRVGPGRPAPPGPGPRQPR